MRRAIVTVVGVVAVALVGAGPAGAAVTMIYVGPPTGNPISFSPADATIHSGDTVHWVWSSPSIPHSTTSGTCSTQSTCHPDAGHTWSSGDHTAPNTFDTTLTKPAVYNFYCDIHLGAMTGRLTVVAAPAAAFTFAPPSPAVGQTVTFDGTGSTGSGLTYAWDFGDGSAAGSGAQPTHAYTAGGSYQVTLTVTDTLGATNSVTHAVTVPSNSDTTAAYSFSPASPTTGAAVSFDASASADPDGSITSYSWNFGDGSAAGSGKTTTHAFAIAGAYTVVLTVTDSSNQMVVSSEQITVASGGPDESPTATFALTRGSPVAGQTVALDATGSNDPDGSIASYRWDFGDGSAAATGVSVKHTFTKHGRFMVKLTVTDSQAQSASQTTTIVVGRPAHVTKVKLSGSKLTITVNGAGVLRFRLREELSAGPVKFRRHYRVKGPATVRLALGAAVGPPRETVALHFTPAAGSPSTARITLGFSAGHATLTKVRLPRGP